MNRIFTYLMLSSGIILGGCASAVHDGEKSTPDTFAADDTGPLDPETGKRVFLPSEGSELGKSDSLRGSPGLSSAVDQSASAVWSIRNQWTEHDTPEARQAGMAWPADSGLTWNEKYAAWVMSLRKIESIANFDTYEVTTPYGKTLPAPVLECAETSIFLRVAFASWYGLPFFLEARDRDRNRLYLGHFGFRTANGRYPNSPNFRTRYRDYMDQAKTWHQGEWPRDAKLRGKKLGGNEDDWQSFLYADARAGAYFDEIFLNKRVGHFMIFALSYFGSMNLADSRNSYNITAKSIRAGDTLLERWLRRGTGHTLVVKSVVPLEDDTIEVDLISGSMPRRQGKWDDTDASRPYLTSIHAGGPGSNDNGRRFAQLGGGLKRWRIAQRVQGKWANMVDPNDADAFISNRSLDTIENRVIEFETLLPAVSIERQREILIERIQDKREHLRMYPSSCSARAGREEAFMALYDLEKEQTGLSVAEVDARYRILDDYVFAELVYNKSKTCCWNSTTPQMYEIIIHYSLDQMLTAEENGECRQPLVFMNHRNGYETYRQFAISTGRGDQWAPWQANETCPQAQVSQDLPAATESVPFCQMSAIRSQQEGTESSAGDANGDSGTPLTDNEPQPSAAVMEDFMEPNNSQQEATPMDLDTSIEGVLCPGDEDWFSIDVKQGLTLELEYTLVEGDIDMALFAYNGAHIETSDETDDDELIDRPAAVEGTYFVKLHHFEFESACQHYYLSAD